MNSLHKRTGAAGRVGGGKGEGSVKLKCSKCWAGTWQAGSQGDKGRRGLMQRRAAADATGGV